MIKKQLMGFSETQHIQKEYMEGQWSPPHGITMIGYKRLCNIELLVNDVIENKIEGHLIETGVWRGGAVIYMKYLLNKLGSNKKVFVADSFKGLPKPELPQDEGDKHHEVSFLRVTEQEVRNNFKEYGLLDKRVIFIKGWFKHTLHRLNETFCIIRLDGDMYESTMDALNALYPKLNTRGYVVIDDYLLPNCWRAVSDYREREKITQEIIRIDDSSVYWQK
jgi:O-methyltransferase